MNIQDTSVLPEIISYDLHVKVWDDEIPIQVKAKLEVRNPDSIPLRNLTLYLHPELSVTSAFSQDGNPIEVETEVAAHDWSYTKALSSHSLMLPEPTASGDTQILYLSYEGSFSPSSLRSPSDFMRIDRGGAYLRGLGYSLWFPVTVRDGIDLASRFHIQLDVPSEWKGVAFGDMEKAEHSGQRNVSWWRTPNTFKLLQAQLIASPLEISEGRNLSVFALQDSSKSAHKLIEFGDLLLLFFASNYGSSDRIGRTYVVETCPYGCIASGNVIGLSPEVFQRIESDNIDLETYDLIAHELVHGFVTPLIDQSSPGAALLLEGFPSYFHVPAATEALGSVYYEWFFRRAWESYREGLRQQADPTGGTSIPIDKPLLEIRIDDIPYYKDRFLLSDKFPILLDRLRQITGSNVFFAACREFFLYAATHHVTISDFFHMLEIRSYRDLSEFCARWFSSTEFLPDCWTRTPLDD